MRVPNDLRPYNLATLPSGSPQPVEILISTVVKHNPWAKLVPALAIACVLALLPAYWIGLRAPAVGLYHDDGIYLSTGKALATGKGYRLINLPSEIPQTKYPVLFPLSLAAVWKLFPHFPENVFLFKLVPFTFLLIWMGLSYLLLRSEGMPRHPAILAVLLTWASPSVMYLGVTLLSETLFAALCTGALLLVRKAERGAGGPVMQYGAGIVAALAALTRTAGLPLTIAGAVALLWRRGWKAAIRFCVASLLLYLPWVIWVASHQVPQLTDAYYSMQNYGGWNILFNFSWAEKLAIGEWNVFYVALTPLSLLGMASSLTLGGGVLALRGFMQHLRRRPSVIHLFLILYLAVILCWAWIPTRFVTVILPLALFFMWQGIPGLVRKQRLIVCATMALLLALLAGSLRAAYAHSIETLHTGIAMSEKENWRDMLQMTTWIREHTSRDIILLSNIDPALYLYTDRKSVRGFYADPYLLFYSKQKDANPLGTAEAFREAILRQGVSYIVTTPDEGFAEKPYLKRLISELGRSRPGALSVAYEGATTDYRVYRIDRALCYP